MTIRYQITLGAKTTAGGTVITAAPLFTIHGVPVAHEDDSVSCPACKTVGVIKPDGPRLSETHRGKEVALSGDLCICKCARPPRLIGNQTFSCQEIDGDWHAEQAGAAAESAAGLNAVGNSVITEPEGVPFVLLDPDTDEPYKYRPYRLQLQDSVIEGTTDQNGATRPLTAQEQATFIQWHVDHDTAPA